MTAASDYSKAAMKRFMTVAVDQGLLNPNTAAGWNAAIACVFEDVGDGDDVRAVDVATAIKRYHNKHPGELKGTVLAEYQRRVKRVIHDFVKYTDDPTSYKGRGKSPTDPANNSKTPKKKPAAPASNTIITPGPGTISVTGFPLKVGVGMSLDYNLRPDFLAQVVVPRDMNSQEARRLANFIMALATDYQPA